MSAYLELPSHLEPPTGTQPPYGHLKEDFCRKIHPPRFQEQLFHFENWLRTFSVRASHVKRCPLMVSWSERQNYSRQLSKSAEWSRYQWLTFMDLASPSHHLVAQQLPKRRNHYANEIRGIWGQVTQWELLPYRFRYPSKRCEAASVWYMVNLRHSKPGQPGVTTRLHYVYPLKRPDPGIENVVCW
jgi:hypothetical protein